MLLRNRRVSRALSFKEKLEASGRKLDIASYGSLVDHFGRHRQLGSALLLLRECAMIYGAPPGENSLANVRLLCRQHDVEDHARLDQIIGKDPIGWLKHGEKYFKRDMTKKGRRQVNLANNRLL